MTCEELRDRLDAYLDGTLAAEERERLEQHLAACAECRTDLESSRVVRSHLGGLPQEVAPGSNLWQGIAARLPARARGITLPRPILAAAAVLLVALSSTVTAILVRRPRPGLDQGSSAVTAILTSERPYTDQLDGLLAEYQRSKAALTPETRAVVERNLAVIDRAVAEARAALRRDPANRTLETLLLAAYQRKIELLQQVPGLGRES